MEKMRKTKLLGCFLAVLDLGWTCFESRLVFDNDTECIDRKTISGDGW
jgi:hypothetical protein